MTKKEYDKLMSLVLDMRIIDSILYEAVALQGKMNKILAELLLKEDTNALD